MALGLSVFLFPFAKYILGTWVRVLRLSISCRSASDASSKCMEIANNPRNLKYFFIYSSYFPIVDKGKLSVRKGVTGKVTDPSFR